MNQPSPPNFRSGEFLLAHIRRTMAFYHPRCIDPAGGFFHYFKDDGTIYDRSHRHLVSSTRFVFNYAMALREFGNADYRDAALHGLRYLREVHRDAGTGGYAWTIRDGKPEDRTNHCYGLAFVLLAYATACKAGIAETHTWMDETWDLLEEHFWEEAFGLYRDEADTQWRFSGYRGQNANMHMCEAMLAAYEATNEMRYLDRAVTLADNMTRRQAKLANGLVWEHYDAQWRIDWDYHKDDPRHLFRPWGFQPGHQTEWAKLLLIIDRHVSGHASRPDRPSPHPSLRAGPSPLPPRGRGTAESLRDTDSMDWLVPTAQHLFDTAFAHSWDEARGGMVYGFAPDYSVCDSDKYFWVQAESLAAAALLARRTGEEKYWTWYDKLWAYAWQHLVDHRHGAWYRILDADNRKYSDEKSPAGKTDYHTMGACYEVLHDLHRSKPPQT